MWGTISRTAPVPVVVKVGLAETEPLGDKYLLKEESQQLVYICIHSYEYITGYHNKGEILMNLL